MRVQVLQHVHFEDIGGMSPWLEKAGATISYTRLFKGDSPPPVDGIDLVIAMGGPMSVNDEAEFPWLKREKRFIREIVSRNTALLGVCLGAQLIASSLGSHVYRNREREIGWLPIKAAPPTPGTFRFPDECRVFHWHGETFDLPAGAVRLASSAACENQAFQIGRRIIGLQFHLETTPEGVAALLENCSGELTPGPYIQDAERISAADNTYYASVNALMSDVLDYLTAPDN